MYHHEMLFFGRLKGNMDLFLHWEHTWSGEQMPLRQKQGSLWKAGVGAHSEEAQRQAESKAGAQESRCKGPPWA